MENYKLMLPTPIQIDPRGYGHVTRTEILDIGITNYISYVKKGTGTLTLLNKNHKLSPGDIFFIPQNEVFAQTADPGNELEIYWVAFKTSLDLKEICNNPVIRSVESQSIFQNILNHKVETQYTILTIATDVCKLLQIFFEKSFITSNIINSQMFLTEYIRNLIQSSYLNDISFSAIAKQLFLNPNYMSSIFKRHVGISPKQYLTAYRIYTSALFLSSDPTIPTSLLAPKVGYNDTSNFRKAFQTHLNISISDFRALPWESKLELINKFSRQNHINSTN